MPTTHDKSSQSHAGASVRYYAAEMTAVMIAEMDPHSREDLRCYLLALSEAAERNDVDQIDYIKAAIVEVFTNDSVTEEVELEDWPSTAAIARDRMDDHRRENDEFIARYQQLKQAAGFRTQMEVAEACQLSVNTINAIESQRVKPQSRTLQKLAKGLNVSMKTLMCGGASGGQD